MNAGPMKAWLKIAKRKTTRLSTKLSASLGLMSLTRDEQFEKHYEDFKNLEKTIRLFVKNLNSFVEHFESFLLALQSTSDHLSDFYRDKSNYHRELDELKRKNKALACEHFHAFKRTVEQHVVSVVEQLLQKFAGPHQLISKRAAKLLDYDFKSKELEWCKDEEKKATTLLAQHVIVKELYEKINKRLIDELPVFNQFALHIFRECIMVLLESRRNLILSYTKQTASLLETPVMMTYTASEVASGILMSIASKKQAIEEEKQHNNNNNNNNHVVYSNEQDHNYHSRQNSIPSPPNSLPGLGPRPSTSTDDNENETELEHELNTSEHARGDTPPLAIGRPCNGELAAEDEIDGSRNLSADFNQMALNNERVSTPLSQINETSTSADEKVWQDERKKRKFPICVAGYAFEATGPNQLSISQRQQLKLIKSCDECGNSDWSLVQDKRGQMGYVPSSYIIMR